MPQLFTPITLRDLTLRNRTMVSPMCQYSSVDGLANDWHFVHLGRFALGGFGLVMVEASGVTPEGRISYADMGIWGDQHIAPLKRIVDFLHAHGAAAAIQLAHAGRKGSMPNPWRPDLPDDPAERAIIGYTDWQPVAPSAVPHATGWKVPHALNVAEIKSLVKSFTDAAQRAEAAGFDVVEIHGAHGYLIDEFLSPLANKRTDDYGGSRQNRMRFALEVVAAVRKVWPRHKPLFMRFSVQDWHPEGWQVEDSIELAKQVKSFGVDLIDCSSGGFDGAQVAVGPSYQVPLSRQVRHGAGIATSAIGLIAEAKEAERIIADGDADVISFARTALDNPNWPVHALRELDPSNAEYALWPKSAGYAVRAMDKALGRNG